MLKVNPQPERVTCIHDQYQGDCSTLRYFRSITVKSEFDAIEKIDGEAYVKRTRNPKTTIIQNIYKPKEIDI